MASPDASAIVDWSNARHGFGLSADVAIRCDNDDEVVEGVIRAIKAQPDTDTGGADFVWGRLRELEYARGWATDQESGPGETLIEGDGDGRRRRRQAVGGGRRRRRARRRGARRHGAGRGARRVQRDGGHARVLPAAAAAAPVQAGVPGEEVGRAERAVDGRRGAGDATGVQGGEGGRGIRRRARGRLRRGGEVGLSFIHGGIHQKHSATV